MKEQKKLIFVADDFGLADFVNRGIIDAVEHSDGLVSTISVMSVGEKFVDAINYLQKHQNIEVFVHLCCTYGHPLTNMTTQIDKNGNFLRNNRFEGMINADFNELKREWHAQITRIIDKGIKVMGINGHHHVEKGEVTSIVMKELAKEFGIAMRNPSGVISNISPSILAIYGEEHFYGKDVSIDFLQRQVLLKLQEELVMDICVHPGVVDEEAKQYSSYNIQRLNDLQLLKSLKINQWMKANEIAITTYGNLKKQNA